MKASLADLTVNVNAATATRIIEDWLWLVGSDKNVILVTVIGDLVLKGGNQSIYWLETGGGKFEKVAGDAQEFESKLTDINMVNE